MMSLYGEYIKERENLDILETDNGFVTFLIHETILYIQDVYVKKNQRRTNVATELVNEVVRFGVKGGANILRCQADLNTLNWEDSIGFIKMYGCIPCKLNKNTGIMYFEKKIG